MLAPARMNITNLGLPVIQAGSAFAATRAADSFVMDEGFAAGVVSHAEQGHADRMARIFRAPDLMGGRAPIGDAKFNGVPLGMPGGEAKVIFDPSTTDEIREPESVGEGAVSDPVPDGTPDGIYAVDLVPVISAIFIGIVIVYGLIANHMDNQLARSMKWKSDNIDRRRINDFERALAGENPFAKNVEMLKERIRRGDNGLEYLDGNYELWDDATRALIEVLVEEREKAIPGESSRRRRITAIAEVRNLLRMESEKIFQNPWFPRMNEGFALLFLSSNYDNVEEVVTVAKARLMTLEKAASANGNMDWAKGAMEELRIIDPARFSNVRSITV